jgi:predicted TIM-barrel fold metal-dependent hydrolase
MNTIMMKIGPQVVAALLLAGCAHDPPRVPAKPKGAPPASAPAAPSPEEKRVAPLVDHHVHLLSPAAARTALRTTPVPAPFDGFLRERERSWNHAAGLEPLFDEQSALINGRDWIRGRKAIADSLAGGYTGPYLFRPVSHLVSGAQAQIAGYLVEGDGTDFPFAFFHLLLTRARDGAWRIQTETQIFPGPALEPPLTAAEVVKRLDEVGTRRAVVVSNAYYFALGADGGAAELEKVRAENDWTAQQVAQFPDRLVAFCSFNPLREYALDELARCDKSGKLKGLKLHLNAAQIDYRDANQVAKVRAVMAAANARRLPMIIHVRSSDTYGKDDAEVFLRQLVAAAPDVTIQIAHLWGGESFAGDALAVYAKAVAARDPVAKNLYFDISGAWRYGKPEQMPEIIARIREIGVGRILYASDQPPSDAWAAFRKTLPLTEDEVRAIATNVAPYLR